MSDLRQTPSQTVGPYFAYGLAPEQYGYPFLTSLVGARMADEHVPGTRMRLSGRVLDGEGVTVPDAMIEVWQADSEGRYAHPSDPRGRNIGFTGFGRCGTGTDAHHRFLFDTVKPGSAGPEEAPHLTLIVFMRGLLTHAYTRVYFPDEVEANAADPVLRAVPEGRRHTLIAEKHEGPTGLEYRFDIHMQGARETVFFDL